MSDKQTQQILWVDCPNCKTKTAWNKDNAFRPFCSQRCRDADFIQWANEEHVMEGQSSYDDVMSDDISNPLT